MQYGGMQRDFQRERYAKDYGKIHWTYSKDLLSGAFVLQDPVQTAKEESKKSKAAKPASAFDDRRLRRSLLLWEIDGTLHADPSPAQLRALVRGRDKAVIKPPRSKADYDGTIWGAHPI